MILYTTIGRGLMRVKVRYELLENGRAEVEEVFQMFGMIWSHEDSSGLLHEADYYLLCRECDIHADEIKRQNLESSFG